MGLKEAYYAIEDAYYGVLDKINEAVPVYKVIDPIDKVIPSMILLIVIILAIAGGTIILSQQQGQASTLVTLEFRDKDSRQLVSGAQLSLSIAGKGYSFTTSATGTVSFEAVPGQSAILSASAKGYQKLDQNFTVEKELFKSFLLQQNVLPGEKDKDIYFADDSGRMLDGKLVTVYLSCSTGALFTQAPCAGGSLQSGNAKAVCTTSNGQVSVLGKFIPKNCGKLLARASLAGYDDKDFEVGDGFTIKFSAAESAKGNAAITVKDEKGNPVDGAMISLYESSGILSVKKLSSYGRAEFEGIKIGSYYASAEKDGYVNSGTQNFTVSADSTANAAIILASAASQSNAFLNVWVKDKQSNSPITGAIISLRNSAGQFVGNNTTDSNGYSRYAVPAGQYHIGARMDASYLGAETDLNLYKGDNNSFLQLERMTSQNSGVLIVNVVDEDDKNVSGAEVFLYESENGKKGFLANYASRVTDLLGIAKWTGVEEKEFIASARKSLAIGDSTAFTVKKAEQNKVKIKITIGETTLNISAFDSDGKPVPNAQAEFRSIGGALVGSVLLKSDGTLSQKLKADKTVYAVISSPNYMPWVSQTIELKPNDAVSIKAILQARVPTGKPKIEFLGAFDAANSNVPATELKTGNSYLLKWSLQIPERGPNGESLSQAGVHVRLGKSENGKQNLMANDQIYFKSIGVPAAPALKGTSYSPGASDGYSFDSKNTTNSDFKWANVVLDSANSAQYTITAIGTVRDTAVLGDSLMVQWRAWLKTQDGTYITTPEDATVTGEQQLFYAATNSQEYFAGIASSCNSELCYTGENLINLDQKEVVKSSSSAGSVFSLRVSSPHTLSFTLLSDSDNTYVNPQLYVKALDYSGNDSDSLKISAYKIVGTDNVPHSAQFASGAEVTKIEGLEVGSNWKKGGKLQADINLALSGNSSAILRVYVISNSQRVQINGNDAKEITLNPGPSSPLNVSVFPQRLFSGITQDLNATVKDDKGIELYKALVSVSRRIYSQTNQIGQAETGNDGNASFKIQDSYLGENSSIIVSASKAGFATATATIGVSGNGSVISVDPAKITASVTPTQQQTPEIPITIQNNTGFDLDLNGLQLIQSTSTTDSQTAWGEYLDVYTMNRAVASFVQTPAIPIKAHSSVTKNFFMAKLLTGTITPVKALGTLRFITKMPQGSSRWITDVPVEISVGYSGNSIDSLGCLSIDQPDWTTATLQTISSHEFTLTNNCTSGGSPIQLQNLKATISWNGNILGNVQLKLDDPQASQSITQSLKQNSFTLFYPTVGKGSQSIPKEYLGMITFNPFTGNVGQTAKFSVQIRAELASQSGTTIVQTNRDVSGQIGIIDLKQCISLSPAPQTGITVGDSAPSNYTVSADCGSASVNVRLCWGDNGCKGGTAEGGISVSPIEFPLTKGGSQTITVSKQTIPGIYGITMQAKAENGSWIPLPTKTMKAIVNPSQNQYFSLDKYEFNLPAIGEKDMVYLTNTGYQGLVSVKASKCDWKTAQEKGFWKQTGNVALTTAGGALAGLAIGAQIGAIGGPIGALIGAALGFLGGLFMSIFGHNPCDDFETYSLPDYFVNLSGKGLVNPTPADESSLELELGKNSGQISPAGFNTEVWEFAGSGSNGLSGEKLGVMAQNDSANSSLPIYGMMTVKGTRYVYSNQDAPYVRLDRDNVPEAWGLHKFAGNGSAHDVYKSLNGYSQKFHVQFNTAQQEQDLPLTILGANSCIEGVKQGYSGQNALPKTKLNWSWSDATGIAIDSCDESNAKGIYCDATQFGIELSKRVNALDEFLKANNYNFSCPTNPLATSTGTQSATYDVPAGTLGIQYAGYEMVGRNVTLHLDVKNGTSGDLAPNLSATITPPTDAVYYDAITKNANFKFKTGKVTRYDFNFFDLNSNPDNDAYKIDITLAGGTGITPATITLMFTLGQSATCWLPRSTLSFNNVTPLEVYINKNDPTYGKYVTQQSVNWTKSVPDIESLRALTHFHAKLMKDGYGRDFQKDFADYYSNISFADAPSYFTNSTNGLSKYFGQENPYIMNFSRKYSAEPKLGAPGLYNADVEITYGDDWRLFDAQGNPKGQIDVKFYLLSEPYPDSAFYYLPFDGMTGLQQGNDNLQRDGYGIAYNLLQAGSININSDFTPVQAKSSSGSSNSQVVDVKTITEMSALNTDIGQRGNLFSLNTRTSDNVKEMFLSPSIPTPLILKINHSESTSAFNAFYTLYDPSAQPVNTGGTLTYWSGAGACLDFSGSTVQEAFNQKADQKATTSDGITGAVSTYKVGWDSASKAGNEYLKTIIYAPANGYSLKAEGTQISFITPAIEGQTVSLNGIGISSQKVSSISSLMQLVSEGTACITDSGTKASIWWNPKAVYEAKTANNTSVWGIEQTIGTSARQCILN